jgi:translocator protein
MRFALAGGGYPGSVQTTTVRHQRPVGESVVAALIFAVATIAVAAIGSLATSSGRDWYDTLQKPAFTPPDATFGIVWTILYVAIAVAGWLAWRASASTRPTVWWAVQMALNLLWTAVFFGLESPIGGVVVIAALLAAVVMDLRASARVDSTAAVLLFPYLVWCGFAAALTVGVAVLN